MLVIKKLQSLKKIGERKISEHAFTIIELIVVISVIGVLAAISAISYGSWQKSLNTTQVKSDLNGAKSAMENARNFSTSGGYPASVTGIFTASKDTTMSGGSTDSGKTYCIDAVSAKDASITYYMDSSIGQGDPASGTCATRTSGISAPAGLAATAASVSSIDVSWGSSAGATSYTLQMASNSSFTDAKIIATQATMTFTATSLNANTDYYFRVSASKTGASSVWSSVVKSDANDVTIATPAAPVVSQSTTDHVQTSYSWIAPSCDAGLSVRYRYNYTITSAGYNSGWISGITSTSLGFTSYMRVQTYGLGIQAQCYDANNSSAWSTSGTTSYYRPSDTWRLVAASSSHTCGVAYDEKVYCWGRNINYQLGNNSKINSSVPVAVATGVIPVGTIKSIISNSNYNTCVIASDDKVYCWGFNSSGQLGINSTTASPVPVALQAGAMPAGAVKVITNGFYHFCAIASNDKVYCWGLNTSGQLGDNSTAQRLVPVAVSTGAMPAGAVKTIAAGNYHTCAIASDDKVYCWGMASNGQLGNNSTTQSNVPVAVSTGAMPVGAVKSISGSDRSTCAIASNDKVYCWGLNTSGQLGNNSTTQSLVPVAVSTGATPTGVVKSISAGNSYVCVIASNDKVYCWGDNTYYQLGNNSTTRSLVPVAVSTGAMPTGAIKLIKTGEQHACAIASDNKMYCWGRNQFSQIGNNSMTWSKIPVAISNGAMPVGAVKVVSSGNANACAIASDDKVYCWGGNDNGELGNNSTLDLSTPVAVSAGAMPVGIVKTVVPNAGSSACAIASNSKVYCWGSNGIGQLGNNTTTPSLIPVAVSTGATPTGVVKSLVGGGDHFCVIASDDKAYCWGGNSTGQLGNNSITDALLPVAVSAGAMPVGVVKALAGGIGHTCAIASDDKVYCWGSNGSGELGNGTQTESHVPVAVSAGAMPVGAVKAIAAGYSHTCAIASDNKAYCWGENTKGKLGNNSTTRRNTPVAVSIGSTPTGVFKTISASWYNTCGIASDDKAYCWGDNTYGQLGNGTVVDSWVPAAVSSGTQKSVSVGSNNICALSTSSAVYCWGESGEGELGTSQTVLYGLTPTLTIFQPI